jgi:hypothetical protein
MKTMKKWIGILCVLCGLAAQPAVAAPMGWYQMDLAWRDGSFSGRIFHDSASPYGITQVQGTLTDLAQVTAITDVWNASHAEPAPWVFLDNAAGGDIDNYNAGFYLNLVDLGAGLGLDINLDNGLYDWSNDFAWYTPDQLEASPLLSWSIAPAAQVPVPGTLALLGLGLIGAAAARRRAGA